MKVMVSFSSRMPQDLAEKWQELCEKLGIQKQDAIEEALRAWCEKQENADG